MQSNDWLRCQLRYIAYMSHTQPSADIGEHAYEHVIYYPMPLGRQQQKENNTKRIQNEHAHSDITNNLLFYVMYSATLNVLMKLICSFTFAHLHNCAISYMHNKIIYTGI